MSERGRIPQLPARPLRKVPPMRKFLLLTAAVSLLLAPPAFAGDKKPERESVCRVPDIDLSYDTETFTTLVSLPVSLDPREPH